LHHIIDLWPLRANPDDEVPRGREEPSTEPALEPANRRLTALVDTSKPLAASLPNPWLSSWRSVEKRRKLSHATGAP
jgi:hypothetical protein